MKILTITLALIILPYQVFAITENQCYLYASILMVNEECLLDNGVSEEMLDKKKAAMDNIGPQCLSSYKDAWIAGLGIGADELKKVASCKEISEEFIELIRKFGR